MPDRTPPLVPIEARPPRELSVVLPPLAPALPEPHAIGERTIVDTTRRAIAQALRTEASALTRIALAPVPAPLRLIVRAPLEAAVGHAVGAIADWIDPSCPDPDPHAST